MKKLLPIALLLTSTVMASEPKDSIEISIKDLDFTMPKSGKGIAGQMNFSRVNMYRDGMVLALDNEKMIFNSKIFIRPTFIGFKSDFTSIGFKVEDGTFSSIKKTNLRNSKIIMNETYFNFSGQDFSLLAQDTKLQLHGFRYYCDAHPELDSTSGEGIIAGCLMKSAFNGIEKNKDAQVDITYVSNEEQQEQVRLLSEVKKLELKEDKIVAGISSINMDTPSMTIRTGEFALGCSKDETLIEMDGKKLATDCANSLELKEPVVSITPKKEGVTVNTKVKELKISENEIDTKLENASIKVDGFSIFAGNADVVCAKQENIMDHEAEQIEADCLNKISVNSPLMNIRDEKEKSKFNLDLEKFEIKDGNLVFRSNDTEIVDEGGNTNLLGLKLDCQMTDGRDIMDIDTFLAQCLKKGSVGIKKLNSTEIKKKRIRSNYTNHYNMRSIYNGKDKEVYRTQVKKDTSAKDLHIDLSDNKLYLEARVNIVFGKFFTIKIWADVEHIEGDTELIIKVKKTKLPLGLKWVGLLMHYVKKYTRSVENISVDGKNIHILL